MGLNSTNISRVDYLAGSILSKLNGQFIGQHQAPKPTYGLNLNYVEQHKLVDKLKTD